MSTVLERRADVERGAMQVAWERGDMAAWRASYARLRAIEHAIDYPNEAVQ